VRFARGVGDRPAAGGPGLGLAIVRGGAEAPGGTALVIDAEGGGARFVVELPATAIQTPAVRVESSDAAHVAQPKGAPQP
jgi:signal transduction histidine kinase